MCMESKQGMTPTGGKEMYSGTMGTNQGRGAANFRSIQSGGTSAGGTSIPSSSGGSKLDEAYYDKTLMQGDVGPKQAPTSITDAIAQHPSFSATPNSVFSSPEEKKATQDYVDKDEQERKAREAILNDPKNKELLEESRVLRTRNALAELQDQEAAKTGEDKNFFQGPTNLALRARNTRAGHSDEAIRKGAIKLPDVLAKIDRNKSGGTNALQEMIAKGQITEDQLLAAMKKNQGILMPLGSAMVGR